MVKLPVYSYKTKHGKKFLAKVFIKKGKSILKRGFDSKLDAMLYEAQLQKSSRPSKTEFKCGELSSAFIDYLYSKYKEASAYRHTCVYRLHVEPFFKDFKVKDVSNLLLVTFNKKINSLHQASIKNIVYLAKQYVIFLKQHGLDMSVTETNLYAFTKPYVEKKSYDFYTFDEFKLFISAVDDPMYKLIFLMLFDYGLRIGELRGLKHSDLNGNKLYIKRCITNKSGHKGQVVTSVKTAASLRDYPILKEIKDAYNDYISSYTCFKNSFMFLSQKQKHKVIGETTIKKMQVYYCNKVGLRVIKLHEFRHSCATYLFNKGAEVELVSSWLGHSDSSVTLRVYAHLLPSRKLQLVKFFDDE